MSLQPASARGSQQELIVALIAMILGLASILLFAQERLVYYLSGFLGLVAIGYCQFNTKRWIYLSFLSMPISPSIPIFTLRHVVTAELSDFVVMITVFIFFLNYVLGHSKKKGFDPFIAIPLFIFLVVNVLIIFLAYYRHFQIGLIYSSLGHLLKWSGYVLLYLAIFKTFDQEKDFINLLKLIIFVFAAGSLVTIYRYLTHSAMEGGRTYRAGGWFEGINSLGVVLAMIMVFSFNLFISGKSKKVFPNYLFYILWCTMLVALLSTLSRTAWVSMGGGIVILSFVRGRRYLGVLFIVATALVFLAMGQPIERRIEMTFTEQPWSTLPIDLGGREGIQKVALNRILKSPLVGVGFSNFSQFLMGTTPHNQYLSVLGESGVFGFAAFLFLIYRLLRANIFLMKNHPYPFFRECGIGSFCVFLILFVTSFTGEYFTSTCGIALYMAFFACSRVTYQMALEKSVSVQDLKYSGLVNYKYQITR